jgi:hypothetical protein
MARVTTVSKARQLPIIEQQDAAKVQFLAAPELVGLFGSAP